jgi:methionine synthase II (cobalamin-independent)
MNIIKMKKNYFMIFLNALLKDIKITIDEINPNLISLISPYLGYYDFKEEEIELLNEFINKLKEIKKEIKISINLYFIKNSNKLSKLKKLNVDIIGVDLCYGDREEIIKNIQGINKQIALGLIDSNISLIEDVNYLLNEIKRINEILKLNNIIITNSSDLDLLPFNIALEKVKVLRSLNEIQV